MGTAARSPGIVFAILFAILAAGGAACTVVSGWSDVQGGTRTPAGTDGGPAPVDGGTDAVVLPPEAGPDAGDAGADATIPGVPCGTARCLAPQGCCLTFEGTKECSSQSFCTTNGGSWLTCASPAGCPATAPICCYDIGEQRSKCQTSCGTVGAALCDPSEAKPCLGTQACTKSVPGAQSLRSCQ